MFPQADQVTKNYQVPVLHGVDLVIEAGQFMALMGHRTQANPLCCTSPAE